MTKPPTTDLCDEFLDALDELRNDNGTVHMTAHTSSVSADAWSSAPDTETEPAPATPAGVTS